ncbi:protein kinase [Lotmaria passim]
MPVTAEKSRLANKGLNATSAEAPARASPCSAHWVKQSSFLSTASTSLLYALLLRTGALRGGHARESLDRAPHSPSASYGQTPRTSVELEVAVSEALRSEVNKLLPYRGVLVDNTTDDTGLLSSCSILPPASSNTRDTPPRKDGTSPARQWSAALVRLNVYDEPAKEEPSPTATASASTSAAASTATLSTTDATGTMKRRKLSSTTIVVKKRPPPRIANAEAAAAAAAAAATAAALTTFATAPAPLADITLARSSLKPSFADDKSIAKVKPRFTIVSSAQVSAAFTRFKALLDDFAAAIEQCRVAMEEQRSGTMAAWEMAKMEDDMRELSASEDATVAYPQTRRKSPGPRRRGNNTVLVTNLLPPSHSAQLVSPNSLTEMLRSDHAGGNSSSNNFSNNGYVPLTGRSISVDSLREVGEQSTCGLETAELPKGIVAITYAIADHLYAIFHPTSTVAELEEEVAALESQARGDGAHHVSASLQARRARPGTATEESRCVSPTSRTSHSISPLTWPRTGRKTPRREAEPSTELVELKAAVHDYIWDRITSLVSSISLNLNADSGEAAGAAGGKDADKMTSTEEERKTQAYVQLPFLIWLYAASGLATDVVRGSEEVKANTVETATSSPLTSSAAGAASFTLSRLLPTVDTLARQLQRHQYERVQPTAETLLTADTFLAFTGVKMTDKAIMERLFPLQNGAAVNDALPFSTVQSAASLLAHDAADFEDLSTTTTATFNQFATLVSTTTASEAPLSLEEPVPASTANIARSGSFVGCGGSGARVGGSPLRCVRGAFRNSTASQPSGVETQVDHDHATNVSTVEMYLSWLRGKEDAATREAGRESLDAPYTEVKGCDSRAPLGRIAAQAHRRDSDGAETPEDGGERSGAELMGGSSSSSHSSDSCATQRQQDEVFHLSSVMPSADLAPCPTRVERELHQARGALQFARKLGTLYATQDMNTLLPLLPTLAKEERKLPSPVNPLSARVENGSGALRGSFDSWVMPGSPNVYLGNSSLSALGGSRPLPPSMSSAPTVGSSAALLGGLPPLIVAPLSPSARHSSIPAMLTARRVAGSASTATLFPSILPLSMERESLMAHLNTCAAALLSLSDHFFVSSARALEAAFLLSIVLLSHVLGETVLRGELSASEGEAASPVASKQEKEGGTPTVVAVKKRRFSTSNAGAAAAMTAARTAVTGSPADAPKLPPLSIDLAHVLGFGKNHVHYQHLSIYVRETLISVALSALQQKDVVMTQELLQYIALDTATSHRYAQTQRQQQQQAPVITSAATKLAGSSQRGETTAASAASPTTIHKTRKSTKPLGRSMGRWMSLLQNNSASFVNVWFSSFAHLVDTTKHLLKGDHNTPSSLKDTVWHLAGLAQFFLLTRARGYDMYGGRSHLAAASQPVCVDDLSAMLSVLVHNRSGALRGGAGGKAAELVASPALQHYIRCHLVEPAEKVLGVLVSFMESIAEALTADMDSGAALERQQREGVMFADVMSEDDNATAGLAAEASDYPGSACDSLSQMSSEAGGGVGGGAGAGCNSAANRSDAQEVQSCWMELAVHYFLEIIDVLLDVSLYLPEKPLFIYQLTVSASRKPAFPSDFLDAMMTVCASGPRSPPAIAADYLAGLSGPTAQDEETKKSAGGSPLESFQAFLSRYTSLVLQSAVTRFSVEGISTPAWMAAAAHGSPINTPATTGIGDEASAAAVGAGGPRTLWSSLLASVAASLTPVGLEDIVLSSARLGASQPSVQPPLTSPWPSGAPVSARAEMASTVVGVSSTAARSTMWWPKVRFQRYPHLVRIIEHAQLLCLYLNTPVGDEAAPSAPILGVMGCAGNAASRDISPCLRVSAVTALLNTSTGPCAQLLSVPYACPPLTVEAGSYAANSVPNTSRDRQNFHSPMEQPQGRYFGPASGCPSNRLVLSERVLREVCGGLWIRVEVLQLLRFAAAPLDADGFASFTKMAAEVSSLVREKSMQSHYKAVASMKASTESVLPRSYASTYVRLLFLRYVQAFYADMQALGAAGHAVGASLPSGAGASVSTTQEHSVTDRMDTAGTPSTSHTNTSTHRPSWAVHVDPNNGETTTRSVASPRASLPLTSPLQDLSRRLWTQYCYQLLWALRDLCWSSTEAHDTANNLSIASVYGRLLQMIGGRPNHEDYEDDFDEGNEDDFDEGNEDDDLFKEPEFDLDKVDLTDVITFDRSLTPNCTTMNGAPEGFVDFESTSSDSEAAGEPIPPSLAPQQKAAAATSSAAAPDLSPSDERTVTLTMSSQSSSTLPPGTGTPTGGITHVSANVSDLTTLQSLELRHHHKRSSQHSCADGCDTLAQTQGSISPTTLLPPPMLPQLALTGLRPPLYFASSGDTAAAQEDNYFKEQSKQRRMAEELEDRQRNLASVSVMDANSYISGAEEEGDFEEEPEDFELSSSSPTSLSATANPKADQASTQASKRSRPSAPGTASQTSVKGNGNNEAAPKPPALTIPKLSLGSLGPPLYFTSAGDTGVFAEVTAAVPAPGFSGPDAKKTGDGSPQLPKHADLHVHSVSAGKTEEPSMEKVKTISLPLPPPVLPSVTTKTVGGVALPKLSFGALGPPMYFTSSGDTGGFVEAQNNNNSNNLSSSTSPEQRRPPAEQAASPTFHRSQSQVSTNTARFRSGAAAHGAPPEGGNAPATVGAGRHFDFSSTDDSAASSWSSSFDACAATHKDEDGHSDSDSSLVSSAVLDSEAAPRPGQRKKRTRGSPRLSITPVVAPVVTMELILSLCSIILQHDSGMIQYGYTVSSLTQKRVLPGVSAAQRRWLNSGNNVAALSASGVLSSKSVFPCGGVVAGQADHWRYTPQHNPSSFHVIQALHNYLKDARNTFVVDLLEEWLLDEYAVMERTRMEQFEAEYGPVKHEGRLRTLSLSSTVRSNVTTTTSTITEAASRYTSAMSLGRFVLLRLLLPRAITHLVIPPNERRIGAGGYGSVTSGSVHAISGTAAVLPASWGRRGSRWRPAADPRPSGGTARSASGSHSFGSKSPVSPDRLLCGMLDGLRTPWRVAVYRAAQAVCECDVAIKHLALSAQGSESGNLPVCHAEVLAMYRLRGHPHIVPLLSFDNTKDEYVLVMPNYTLGSFRVWRQKHYQLGYAVLSLPSEANEPRKAGSALQRPLSSPTLSSSLFATCARSLLQVLEAVVFMHGHHIRHGDIKCDNLLIDKADVNKDSMVDPPCLPLSVRLCDFGSCDTCDDDDIRSLKNDIMAGAARFMAGRWGVGRGTEAIQPPEVMSAKRRYTLFHRIMTTTTTTTSALPLPAPLERTDRPPYGSSVLAPSIDQLSRARATEGLEGGERAMTERLRRAELSVDIWACGCLLYEMLTGRMLFGEARLGRLLVLAAADDDVEQDQPSAWKPSGATTLRPTTKLTGAFAAHEGPLTHQASAVALPTSAPSSTRQALDEWERHDLVNAVGTQVVDFMSSLLNLDPLQRPSAAEALCNWKGILVNMGYEV